jgi:hypothetical protein
MMDIENADVPRLRAYLETSKHLFLSPTEKTRQIRTSAGNVAHQVSFSGRSLRDRTELIKLPGTPYLRNINNIPRMTKVTTAECNLEFAALYKELVSQIDRIEEMQANILSNGRLTNREARDHALKFIAERDNANGHQEQWSQDLQVMAFLTHAQMTDALEHWSGHGAITIIQHPTSLNGSDGCMFRLTPHGRDIANGEVPERLNGSTTTIIGSTIASVGPNYGAVSQTIHDSFPSMPPDLKDFFSASANGRNLVESLSEELATRQPREGTLKRLLPAFHELVEGVGASTEIAAHGHEWLKAITDWMTALFPS